MNSLYHLGIIKRRVIIELFNYIIITFSFLIITHPISAQKDANESYFKTELQNLKNDPRITDVQFVKKYYDEATLQQQSLYAKFANDSIERYFLVGKCFHYHPNGELETAHCVDINTLVEKDTTYQYNSKGDIIEMSILYIINTLDIGEINSSKNIHERRPVTKRYYLDINESAYVKEADLVNSLPIYKKTPLRTINILYEEGRIAMYAKYKYNALKGEYITTGDYYFYDEQGQISFVENNDWMWEEMASGISWRKLMYFGDNTKRVKEYINNYFQESESSSFAGIKFAKGYYIQDIDTFPCYISVFHPVEKNNQNIFFVAKHDENLDIMSAKDVDFYTFNNRHFYAGNDNYHYYFHELIADKRLTLYKRGIVPTDSSINYYLTGSDLEHLFILRNYQGTDLQEKNKETIKKSYSWIINKEDEIIQFLLSLPNISEGLKRKIESGVYNIDNIPDIVKEYNH